MDKIKALWLVFRKGEEVADPAKQKNQQMLAGVVTAFLAAILAAAKVFGHEIPIDGETLTNLGLGLAAVYGLYNTATTAATSTKVGLPAKPIEFPAIVDPVPPVAQPTQSRYDDTDTYGHG